MLCRARGLLLLLCLLLAGCPTTTQQKPLGPTASSSTLPPAQLALGPHRVTLLDDGTTVEFLGAVSRSAVADLMAVLEENPRVRVLRLTSAGGSLAAVQAVWPSLRERRLTTVVPLFCASACSDLFLAGDKRLLASGAVLGFHQSSPGYAAVYERSAVGQSNAAADTETQQRMLKVGVAPDFAARVIATPHETMWYPTPRELLAARVITDQAAPGNLADLDREALLDWSLFNDPPFAAYRVAFPQDYRAARALAWEIVLRDGFTATAAAQQPVADALSAAIGPALSVSGDATAAQFYRDYVAAVAFAQQIDPLDCYALFDGDAATEASFPPAAQEQLDTQFQRMIVQLFVSVAREQRRTPPAQAAYAAAYDAVVQEAYRRGLFSKADAEIAKNRQQHRAQFCGVTLRWLSAVLQAEQPEQGIVLRGMLVRDR